jgi:hypothetical protein
MPGADASVVGGMGGWGGRALAEMPVCARLPEAALDWSGGYPVNGPRR